MPRGRTGTSSRFQAPATRSTSHIPRGLQQVRSRSRLDSARSSYTWRTVHVSWREDRLMQSREDDGLPGSLRRTSFQQRGPEVLVLYLKRPRVKIYRSDVL